LFHTVGKRLLLRLRRLTCQSQVKLCVGAQVLCTRNFPELGLANGSRGVIAGMDETGVHFRKLSGQVVRVNMFEVPFDSKLVEVKYLPIKLAWAITIHSAQGMTIDALEVRQLVLSRTDRRFHDCENFTG